MPGVVLLDLAAPEHIFGHCGDPHYSFEVAGLDAGEVRSSAGTVLATPSGLGAIERADTVVVPGFACPIDEWARAAAALRNAARRGARIVSVCVGAFLLAEAGLLDGRRATTHWQHADELAMRYPRVTVLPDVLFVDEGQILTSAGAAAGLDLCMYVVSKDQGVGLAARIARRTVITLHRAGGQAQFIERPALHSSEGVISDVQSWAMGHLSDTVTVEIMARRALLSPRSFQRKFVVATGISPGAWLLRQRLAEAQRLLAETDLSVQQVARKVGLESDEGLRQHFRKYFRTTPTAYRKSFQYSSHRT